MRSQFYWPATFSPFWCFFGFDPPSTHTVISPRRKDTTAVAIKTSIGESSFFFEAWAFRSISANLGWSENGFSLSAEFNKAFKTTATGWVCKAIIKRSNSFLRQQSSSVFKQQSSSVLRNEASKWETNLTASLKHSSKAIVSYYVGITYRRFRRHFVLRPAFCSPT